MAVKLKLVSPELCARCGRKGYVKDSESRRHSGYFVRRRVCTSCGIEWPTYETRIHPKLIEQISAPKPILIR